MTTNYDKFFSSKEKLANFIIENCDYDCPACPFCDTICDHCHLYDEREMWKNEIIDNLSLEDMDPCPFCGATPEIVDQGWYLVACKNPKCHIKPYTTLKETKTDAINLWNKRATND